MNIDKITKTLKELGFCEMGNKYDKSKVIEVKTGSLQLEIRIGEMRIFKKERLVEGFAGLCDVLVAIDGKNIICNARQVIEPDDYFMRDNRLWAGLNEFREIFTDEEEAIDYITVASESPLGPLYGPLLPLPTEKDKRR